LKIIDISIPLSPATPVFPGDPPVEIETVSSIECGHDFRLTKVSMSTHSGTHIDTPSHLFSNGAQTEDINLNDLVGPVHVIEFDSSRPITALDCSRLDFPISTSRVLIKNKTPDGWIDRGAAVWIADRGFRLLGWEGPSVDKVDDEKLPTHRILLERGIQLVENLDLSQVSPGPYFLVCLPLKLIGSDASPARAVLIEDFS
jgi:arylformamidase